MCFESVQKQWTLCFQNWWSAAKHDLWPILTCPAHNSATQKPSVAKIFQFLLNKLFCCGNYSRDENIQGRKLYVEILYLDYKWNKHGHLKKMGLYRLKIEWKKMCSAEQFSLTIIYIITFHFPGGELLIKMMMIQDYYYFYKTHCAL